MHALIELGGNDRLMCYGLIACELSSMALTAFAVHRRSIPGGEVLRRRLKSHPRRTSEFPIGAVLKSVVSHLLGMRRT